MKKNVLYTILICLNLIFSSRTFSYELRAKNFNYVAPNILEFEIFVKGPAPQYYWIGQYVFNFNPGFANNGVLSSSLRSSFSDLPSGNRPNCSGIYNDQLRLSPNVVPDYHPYPLEDFIISTSGDGSKVIRVRLQTTACSFSGNLNLTWRTAIDGGYYTKFYDGTLTWVNPGDETEGYYTASLTNIANPANHFIVSPPPPIIANVLVNPGCGLFPSLKDAFSAINSNAGGIYTNQNVTVDILNNITETSSAILNQTAFTSCLVRPSNNSIIVTAGPGVQELVVLNGADNVTIDGRVGAAGSIQLTLDGNNTAQNCIKLSNAAVNNRVKFVNSIRAVDKNILLGETYTTGNDNNTFENNIIENGTRGISLSGSSESSESILNSGNVILSNEIKNVTDMGIYTSRNTQNTTIEGNDIHNTNVITGSAFYGINIKGRGTTNVLRNKIHNLAGTNANTPFIGISSIPVGTLSFTVNTTINIINNFISIVDDDPFYIYGIYLGSANNLGYVKQTTNVNHNTFYLGKEIANSNTSSVGIGMYITGQAGNQCIYNQYNNLSVNEQNLVQGQHAFEIQLNSGVVRNIDYNCYWSIDKIVTWDGVNYNNLAAYKSAAFPNEQNSIFKNAVFADKITGDLHLSGTSVSDFDLAGVAGTGVTTDYDNELRSTVYPYKGADESTIMGGTTALTLKFYPEGFYYPASDQMIKSIPVNVYLKSSVFPYGTISSNNTTLDVNGNSPSLNFIIPATGLYYIVVNNWNMLATWNSVPQQFTINGITNFDFSTSNSQAFGNNMKQIDDSPQRWGMYLGDVNQDEIINNTDVTQIHNASLIYTIGNVVTDLNGDEVIDADDLAIARNNEANSVLVSKPQ